MAILDIFGKRNKRRELSEILAVCLEDAKGPEGIPDCLRRHPQYASELEPLLRTAMTAQSSMNAPIRETRRLAARSSFLAAAARQAQAAPMQAPVRHIPTRRPPSVLTRPLWSAFAPAVAAAMMFVVAIIPVMSITSTSALPGDWNYGFKRSTERVRLALTLNPADRLNLELAFHTRRLGEIEQLAAAGRLTDPSLVQQLTNESSALVQSVSSNPQLGPSEALKVAQQTQAQAVALSDKVAPYAAASLKPAIDSAVEQTQQVQEKASVVAQAKADSATQTQSSTGQTRSPHNSSGAKPSLSVASDSTATATASATATATAAGDSTATVTATAVASTTPAATTTGTAVALVPPIQAPPALRPPASAAAPVLRPPTNPQSAIAALPSPSPSPAPLVPPAQPPNAQQIVTKQLPAGQRTTFVYNGGELPIPQALSSIAGDYDAVFYTQPQHGGQVYEWYPGQSNPLELLEPGSFVTIQVKPGAPATLTFVVPNNGTSR